MTHECRILIRRILHLGLFAAVVPACNPGNQNPPPPADSDYLAPAPAVYAIQTDGQPQSLASQTVATTGGTVTTDGGLAIEVPADALAQPTTFAITAETITSHDFPAGTTVVTPLYNVTGMNAMANDFVTVAMPLDVSEGEFPAIVSWDPETGRAEVLPLVDYDAGVAKAVTRHFSIFVGIKLPIDFLMNLDYMTTFRAGYDDWQFGNFASWTSTGGVCMGMTASSLWYFEKLKEENLRGLRNQYRYGEYGYNREDTPNFTEDDDVGRRLVSMVQYDGRDDQWNWYYIENPPVIAGRTLTTDELMLLEVATALVVEEAPQYLAVNNKLKTTPHGITCCGIRGNTLYCVDPNHPGQTMSLALNATTHAWTPYDEIVEIVQFVAKSSTATWEIMPALWEQMRNGTIGENVFPSIKYFVSSHDSVTGAITRSFEADLVNVNQVNTPKVSFFAAAEGELDYTVFRLNEDSIDELYIKYDDKGNRNPDNMASITLDEQERVTFGILAQLPVSGKQKSHFGYIDFKWFTVEYVADDEPEPGALSIPDPCLKHALEQALAGVGLTLTRENLAQLGMVSLYAKGISDLTGLEHCVNLIWLDVAYNHIVDLSPLANLTKLETLRVDGNRVTDLTPLSNLTALTFLRVQHQQGDILTDLSGLESLTALETLYADGNAITSIEPLASLAALRTVTLTANAIDDLSPLAGLAELSSVDLHHTYVADLGPLLDSPALNGLAVNVFCTHVDPNCGPQLGDTTQCLNAAAMESAGATVTMPDPTRACTPGPDGTDPFESPACELH